MIRQSANYFVSLIRRFFSREVGLAEMASGIATIGWGSIMLWTAPLPTWRSLDLLLRAWDSDAWGWIDICLGAGQLFVFGLIDQRWRRPWLRVGGAILVSGIWGMNTLSAISAATPAPPWAAAIGAFWFMNVYLIVRISWLRPAALNDG